MIQKIFPLLFLISILSVAAFGDGDEIAEGMIVLKNSGSFNIKVKCETGPYTSRVEMIHSTFDRIEGLLEEEPEPILKGSTILKENDSYTCTAQSIDLSFLPNQSRNELGEDREMGYGGTHYSNHCSEPEKQKLCITVTGKFLEEQYENFEVDLSD